MAAVSANTQVMQGVIVAHGEETRQTRVAFTRMLRMMNMLGRRITADVRTEHLRGRRFTYIETNEKDSRLNNYSNYST